jgi:hypothetical protein
MMQPVEELTVAQRLGQLLDRGLLPAGGPAEAAERLIERLERPARVALLGLPGSGKSAILNLLTGMIVVPDTLRLPTIIVQHGAEARMLCTLTDGRTEVVPGADLSDVLALNPALVTLELDLPALKVISLLEVSAGPMEAEQRRAAIWASKRADILIWCTTSYLPKEQQVWEGMPDGVKDNGFLFLTKVDLLGAQDAAAGMLERVEMRAGEEFRQILSISAKQAREAMPPGAPVNREMFRDSGAAAVITTIKSRVQAARRADTDMAELLLARHVEAGGIVARRFAEPAEVAAPAAPGWTPPPEVLASTEPDAAVVAAEDTPAPLVAPKPEPEPEPIRDPEPEGVPDESEPVLAAEPEPDLMVQAEPAPRPVVTRTPEPRSDSQPEEGRKRFSDRIKQMPAPEDTPAVPLRSTWKSKAETSAARAPEPEAAEPDTPRPDRRGAVEDSRARRADSRVFPAATKEPEPQDDDTTLARLLVSVASPGPEGSNSEPETEDEGPVEDAVASDDVAAEDLTAAEDGSPRWAERLKPADTSAPAERSPRTSLFGTRKAVVAAAPAVGARPADSVARSSDPVTRVRAPAPRPAEPPRPATPSPEELGTPRFVPMRDRPQAASGPGDPPRAERRERTRVARIVPTAPVAVEPETVPAAEVDLLDRAIRHIVARSAELTGAVDPDEKIPVDAILDHSRETVEQVLAVLGHARSIGLRRIVGDLGEIQDIIMLMQLEKGHAPADDALTLLLQIRRDLETLRAV